ncbi:helix-turn-helix transcriptional regulator [Peribacillus sp. SI8-4]|uniref:helix-turn-helix transcriptional regulator n=1 Tax=Peribacillus sp. SI8-4 TaxID=3048009 RepID=UPI00332DE425
MCPSLTRMETKEFIAGQWKESESGRRKYYARTEIGQTERKRKCFSLRQTPIQKSSIEFSKKLRL